MKWPRTGPGGLADIGLLTDAPFINRLSLDRVVQVIYLAVALNSSSCFLQRYHTKGMPYKRDTPC